MTSTIQEMSRQLAAIKAEMKERGAELVGAHLKDHVLALPPEVKGVRWNQYTPYFNDGDPCTFSVNDPRFIMDEEPATGFYSHGDDDYEIGYGKESSPLVDACKAFEAAFREVPEELYEAAFDDHAEITVMRDGAGVKVEVDEYSHD